MGEATGWYRPLRAAGDFRWFMAGKIASLTGTAVQRAAVDWCVLVASHGSGTVLGLVVGVQYGPTLAGGVWAGVWADRWPPRPAIAVTQSLGMGLAAVMALATAGGVPGLGPLFAVAAVQGAITAVENPLHQRFLRQLVGSQLLTSAVGINNAVFHIARLAGPALAGMLIATVGVPSAFAANAVSFLPVLAALAAMRRGALTDSPVVPRGRGQVREGLRYVRSRPDIRWLLGASFAAALCGQRAETVAPLMAVGRFGAGVSTFALGSTAISVGAIIGAVLAAGRQPTVRLCLASCAAFGMLVALSGMAPTYPLFLAATAAAWVPCMLASTASAALAQLSVPPHMAGRLLALWFTATSGAAAVGSPAAGWLTQTLSPRTALLALGLAPAAVAALALARTTRGADSDPAEGASAAAAPPAAERPPSGPPAAPP